MRSVVTLIYTDLGLSSRGNPHSTRGQQLPLRDTSRSRRRSISSRGNAGELFYCVARGGDSSELQCRAQALNDGPSESGWRAEPWPWITAAGSFINQAVMIMQQTCRALWNLKCTSHVRANVSSYTAFIRNAAVGGWECWVFISNCWICGLCRVPLGPNGDRSDISRYVSVDLPVLGWR